MAHAERGQVPQRTVLLGDTAAPASRNAQILIMLLNPGGKVIHSDPDTSPYLECVIVPNH